MKHGKKRDDTTSKEKDKAVTEEFLTKLSQSHGWTRHLLAVPVPTLYRVIKEDTHRSTRWLSRLLCDRLGIVSKCSMDPPVTEDRPLEGRYRDPERSTGHVTSSYLPTSSRNPRVMIDSLSRKNVEDTGDENIWPGKATLAPPGSTPSTALSTYPQIRHDVRPALSGSHMPHGLIPPPSSSTPSGTTSEGVSHGSSSPPYCLTSYQADPRPPKVITEGCLSKEGEGALQPLLQSELLTPLLSLHEEALQLSPKEWESTLPALQTIADRLQSGVHFTLRKPRAGKQGLEMTAFEYNEFITAGQVQCGGIHLAKGTSNVPTANVIPTTVLYIIKAMMSHTYRSPNKLEESIETFLEVIVSYGYKITPQCKKHT